MAKEYIILRRMLVLVNTDPQGRCYDGAMFSSKVEWSEWEEIGRTDTQERAESRLKFWEELNAYAVVERGENNRCEFTFKVSTDNSPVEGDPLS